MTQSLLVAFCPYIMSKYTVQESAACIYLDPREVLGDHTNKKRRILLLRKEIPK